MVGAPHLCHIAYFARRMLQLLTITWHLSLKVKMLAKTLCLSDDVIWLNNLALLVRHYRDWQHYRNMFDPRYPDTSLTTERGGSECLSDKRCKWSTSKSIGQLCRVIWASHPLLQIVWLKRGLGLLHIWGRSASDGRNFCILNAERLERPWKNQVHQGGQGEADQAGWPDPMWSCTSWLWPQQDDVRPRSNKQKKPSHSGRLGAKRTQHFPLWADHIANKKESRPVMVRKICAKEVTQPDRGPQRIW